MTLFRNILMHLVLSISFLIGTAHAGLITTITLDDESTLLDPNYDTIILEWDTSLSSGTVLADALTDLTMILNYSGSSVYEDVIVSNSVVQNHLVNPRTITGFGFSFNLDTMTLNTFDNYLLGDSLVASSTSNALNVWYSPSNVSSFMNGNIDSLETFGATVTHAQSVPEPSTLAIFALGLLGLASRRFKKQGS